MPYYYFPYYSKIDVLGVCPPDFCSPHDQFFKSSRFQPSTRTHDVQTALILASWASSDIQMPDNWWKLEFQFSFSSSQKPHDTKQQMHGWGIWSTDNKWGWGCCSVRGASSLHAVHTCSIPRCGEGFFSQPTFTTDFFLFFLTVSVPTYLPLPRAVACINICAHVKDLVVYARVWWIMEILKCPACTVGWVARLCHTWPSLG